MSCVPNIAFVFATENQDPDACYAVAAALLPAHTLCVVASATGVVGPLVGSSRRESGPADTVWPLEGTRLEVRADPGSHDSGVAPGVGVSVLLGCLGSDVSWLSLEMSNM